MNQIGKNEATRKLFAFFEEISRIPRGSFHESAIAGFLARFASERGIECVRDKADNVFWRIPATAGREAEEPVILQGHTDMVCVAAGGVTHDFESRGIDLIEDGEFLRARGTSLGADDGFAVALMMAVADGAVASHPTVECIFTATEEEGMVGARAFDCSLPRGKKMINLDSESEGKIVAGCAGGVRCEWHFSGKKEKAEGDFLRVTVGGLCGGHSGEDIARGRENANRILARVLLPLGGLRLVGFSGGEKDNAIPRDATAIFAVPCGDDAEKAINKALCGIQNELSGEDAGFSYSVLPASAEECFDEDFSARVLSLLCLCDNGVIEMSRDIAGMVEWSANLGVVRTVGEEITAVSLVRSFTEERLDHSQLKSESLARALGAKVSFHSRYPGWRFEKVSPLRQKYADVFEKLYGKRPGVTIIHAGLECGLLHALRPDIDMISIGANVVGLHSPSEVMEIASAERVFTAVAEFLANG